MAPDSLHPCLTLPPFGSDRLSFQIGHAPVKQPAASLTLMPPKSYKLLLIDGNVAYASEITGGAEPKNYDIYCAYLTQLRSQVPAEQELLQNLTPQQLDLVATWLMAKTEEYTAYAARSYAPSAAHRLTDLPDTNNTPLKRLCCDLSAAIEIAQYEPTALHIIDTIHQLATSLAQRHNPKAAQKLRLAGNAIQL